MYRSIARRRRGFSPYGDRAGKKRHVFTNSSPRAMLILFHRKEPVQQSQKYFDCSFRIGQGQEHSWGEEVVSASVQLLVRCLYQFAQDDFDILVTDEAHHAAVWCYKKFFNYFKPRLHAGVTDTSNQEDH